MKENGTLQVLYDGKVVGNLALMAGRKIAFEYSEEWLETGYSMVMEEIQGKRNCWRWDCRQVWKKAGARK